MAVSNKHIPIPGYLKDHSIRMILLYPSGKDPLHKDTELYLATLFKHEVDAFTDPLIFEIIRERRFQHINMDSFFVESDMFEYNHKLFLFVNADCAFPPHYLVASDTEDEALDTFLSNTDSCLVEEPDLQDYSEDSLSYDDKGRPMDTSQLQMVELKIMLITFVDYSQVKKN